MRSMRFSIPLFALMTACHIHARTYTVAPAGSDDSAGTAGAPLATIQKAASRAIAGDTVLMKKARMPSMCILSIPELGITR